MGEFELTWTGPFSFPASLRFLAGFTPAGVEESGPDRLRIAFPVEGDWRTVGVAVVQEGDALRGTVVGDADPDLVASKVARILSLDVDGTGFPRVADRDPVVATLQRRYPGLRPVCFWSSYEAAAWAILSTRVRMTQAAALKRRIATELGETVEVEGQALAAFPAPDRLGRLTELAGLPARKAEYLRALGEAAVAGELDSVTLRECTRTEALARLQRLPGIGPFGAELVLLRGAGDPDAFPSTERRLLRGMTQLYRLSEPSHGELAEIADAWRPYRTWVSVLIRASLENGTTTRD